jgi:hypothetical protein
MLPACDGNRAPLFLTYGNAKTCNKDFPRERRRREPVRLRHPLQVLKILVGQGGREGFQAFVVR